MSFSHKLGLNCPTIPSNDSVKKLEEQYNLSFGVLNGSVPLQGIPCGLCTILVCLSPTDLPHFCEGCGLKIVRNLKYLRSSWCHCLELHGSSFSPQDWLSHSRMCVLVTQSESHSQTGCRRH